ncbi:MAG: DUF1444 family protein [Chloroflexi bacterium]|nr:DUF1444 family protein [Chloroflexota bacterium]
MAMQRPDVLDATAFAQYLVRRLTLHDDVLADVTTDGRVIRARAGTRAVSTELGRFYQAYAARPDELDTIVSALVTVLTSDVPERSEREFTAIAPRLLPMLKPADILVGVRERRVPMLAYQDFPGELVITYAIREARSVVYINEVQLDAWGVDVSEVHRHAIANLRRRTAQVQAISVGDSPRRLFMFNTGDGCDAARILLGDIIETWTRRVTGTLVIGIPHRDLLIGFGDADAEFAQTVTQQIQLDALASPSRITERLFSWQRGRLVPHESD